MSDITKALAARFPADVVSWRVGPTTSDKKKGMALAYIDARDVMERLDEVCGPAGWQCRYPHANGKTVCEIGVKCGDEWVWKADGAGDTDHEAEKGALSDAFKRAAVRWGIGRYLYDTPATWVEIEQHGKSYSIKKSELSKLGKVLESGARAESTPEPRDGPTARETYMGLAEKAIDATNSAEDLRAWWKSESQNRRDADLTQADVDDLKARLLARVGEIETPQPLLMAG